MVGLRQRFEREHGRASDSIFPCTALVEKRLEEVEEGSVAAQLLSDVICVAKAVDEVISIPEAGTGIAVRRIPKSIAMLTNTEELRCRLRTLGISFVLAG